MISLLQCGDSPAVEDFLRVRAVLEEVRYGLSEGLTFYPADFDDLSQIKATGFTGASFWNSDLSKTRAVCLV